MSRSDIEIGVLSAIRFLGWLNLLSFTWNVGSKVGSWFLLFNIVICFLATGLYYTLWKRLIKTVDYKAGVSFILPYRIGTVVVLIYIMVLSVFWFMSNGT